MHTTSAASERNWSTWGSLFTSTRNRLGIEKAQKMVYVKANYDDDEDENEEEDGDLRDEVVLPWRWWLDGGL